MAEYVIVSLLGDDKRAPVHTVREYGQGMRVTTECKRHLFYPIFVDEPSPVNACEDCLRVTVERSRVR